MLLLMLIFCLDCDFFRLNKVNYALIFEFDTHHDLDWKQLSEVSGKLPTT